MNNTVSYRGYHGSIIHDKQDHLYHGKILGIQDLVIYHGDSSEEAEQVFRTAVDDYMLDFEKTNAAPPKPFASIPVDLPQELQVKAALFAHEHNLDVGSVYQKALSDFLEKAA